ncbi:hypothetical protein DB30_04377 [Enhygromyxa salina]|uniref:Uncharacterized protein n=1 Tax=Enhygromyxa salina TaxID=215803 RepID=A0A0C1ZFL9_9BACT|nr:hypothetical protein DB30_04377 [Enhygromyxa salina]
MTSMSLISMAPADSFAAAPKVAPVFAVEKLVYVGNGRTARSCDTAQCRT